VTGMTANSTPPVGAPTDMGRGGDVQMA